MKQSYDFHKYFFSEIVLFFPLTSTLFPGHSIPIHFLAALTPVDSFFSLAVTRRLKGVGIGRILFPKCHKALEKSFHLKFRLLLWRKLLVDFIIITVPSTCQSQGGSIFKSSLWEPDGVATDETQKCVGLPQNRPPEVSHSHINLYATSNHHQKDQFVFLPVQGSSSFSSK